MNGKNIYSNLEPNVKNKYLTINFGVDYKKIKRALN